MSALSDLILDVNGRMRYDASGQWRYAPSGSFIARITPDTAQWLAGLFSEQAEAHPRVPLSFALAFSSVESKFCPSAYNHNLNGSNPGGDTVGFDVGITQFKVRYQVKPSDPERATPELTQRFLFNPENAIPLLFEKLEGLLTTAEAFRFNVGSDPRAKNTFWTAATCYQKGVSGGITAINAGPLPAGDYGALIGKWELYAAQQLNLTSCMQEVAAT